MKKTLLSIMLLIMTTAVTQAQERRECLTQAGKRMYPHAVHKKRAATRSQVGNPAIYKGEKRGLIILMEFPNLKFINKNSNGKTFDVQSMWNDIANKEKLRNVNGMLVNGSIRDYFRDQSYGQFTINFDVVGPYTAKNKYAYYGRNIEYANGSYDQDPASLIVEACEAASKDVKFKDYDWDEDGEVDQVYVVYAGYGEADYHDTETIWPHKSYLSGKTGSSLTLQDVVIETYACSNELKPDGRYDGIGSICHEFSHCLGLPDVYDAASGESIVGYYDVMDSGNYNGDSWYPAGYSAFERYFCGWMEPKPINGIDEVGELQSLHESPDAYIIRPFEGSTNYWMIEKRQKASWDKFLPCFTENATGEAITEKILCWYIDYHKEKWNRNRPNEDHDHYGISIVDADQVPTAIMASEKTAAQPEAWFDLQGHQLQGVPSKRGIYLVRLSDGTTRKCIR
jgi:M6 family metalloprotease-like protein